MIYISNFILSLKSIPPCLETDYLTTLSFPEKVDIVRILLTSHLLGYRILMIQVLNLPRIFPTMIEIKLYFCKVISASLKQENSI